ncbi:MAG: 3-deoxy-8-phosphooctulonate synthase [Alphaproteobacteria bacterium]|nr:3-deoxy-8-phosphooctulonate synthase [Alphaproteobacteria bacterium]
MKSVLINNIKISNDKPFVFIGGPCAIEGLEHSVYVAGEIKKICKELNIDFIFKSSFDKANRTSISSKRGIGIDEGLNILKEVKSLLNVPVLTDVHLPDQCEKVARVVDVLQIPAFLCRQTDLLKVAAQTGKPVHVKKGQFISPEDMYQVIQKLTSFGCKDILLCERGTFFGYGNLVNDFRSIPIMSKSGYPVVFDATHSVQMPSSKGTCSGGNRDFVPILSKAAVAIGVSAVFMEVHENPDEAPCDGPNMVYLNKLKDILSELKK